VKAREPRKIGVRCVELDPVLDGQSGKMGIGGEISSSTNPPQKLKEDLSVALSGMNEGHLRPGKPRSHDFASSSDRQGIRCNRSARREPQETEDHDPGEQDRAVPVEAGFPP
jgi:hypothetical protein